MPSESRADTGAAIFTEARARFEDRVSVVEFRGRTDMTLRSPDSDARLAYARMGRAFRGDASGGGIAVLGLYRHGLGLH